MGSHQGEGRSEWEWGCIQILGVCHGRQPIGLMRLFFSALLAHGKAGGFGAASHSPGTPCHHGPGNGQLGQLATPGTFLAEPARSMHEDAMVQFHPCALLQLEKNRWQFRLWTRTLSGSRWPPLHSVKAKGNLQRPGTPPIRGDDDEWDRVDGWLGRGLSGAVSGDTSKTKRNRTRGSGRNLWVRDCSRLAYSYVLMRLTVPSPSTGFYPWGTTRSRQELFIFANISIIAGLAPNKPSIGNQ